MRASALAALGLAAYVVFLVATVPASYVAGQLHSGLAGRVQLSEAQGTVWRGSARMRLVAGNTVIPVDRLQWRCRPGRLLRGELAYALRFDSNGVQGEGEVARSFSRWHVRDATAAGDAGSLAAFVPIAAAWRPSGSFMLAVPSLSFAGGAAEGEVRAGWNDAALALSEVRPLGTYQLTWQGEGGAGRMNVATLKGPLRVTGQGKTTPPSGLTFSGEARGEGEAAKALEPLLDLIGPRRPDGARAIELRTR